MQMKSSESFFSLHSVGVVFTSPNSTVKVKQVCCELLLFLSNMRHRPNIAHSGFQEKIILLINTLIQYLTIKKQEHLKITVMRHHLEKLLSEE